MEQSWEKTIFVCGDDLESILTAVYEAWASRKGHSHVKLEIQKEDTMELFSTYVPVEKDSEKAGKVMRSIRQKIGEEAWSMVYRAALSEHESRADDIYRFLIGGFYYGPKALKMLAEPAVYRLMELNRAVGNESHFFKEFLRFDEREGHVLFGRFRPKNNVISLVMPHFADRLPRENFLILDMGRSLAGVHPAGGEWYLASLAPEVAEELMSVKADGYRDLWKTFYQAIAIKERKNEKLQRNMMPLRYREYMTEFLEEG
ncbi:TIGR03915 family putative DNA repair protein [Hominifimenecus sp. rT4P-3]|uniref:TIGR03915 family putative DNA repair protein n=1 Tax=Hominifimenecus sp. rT4P-3 TaxID=3242979 RepID=UPI003DA25DCA